MTDQPRWDFTQPCCMKCWARDNGSRKPAKMLNAPGHELCVHCGNVTDDGIYIRINPKHANYPTIRKD